VRAHIRNSRRSRSVDKQSLI